MVILHVLQIVPEDVIYAKAVSILLVNVLKRNKNKIAGSA